MTVKSQVILDAKMKYINADNLLDYAFVNEDALVYPRGIDPSRSYAVTFDNCGATVELSGAEMMQRGLRVAISGSLSSELIIYEAK